MKTEYKKPVCEIIIFEIEEGVMALSSGNAPKDLSTSETPSGEEDFWGY